MLNEERSFSSLEEVTKLLIAAEGKTFRELDETGRGDSVGNKGSLGNIIEESVCIILLTQMPKPIFLLVTRAMSLK